MAGLLDALDKDLGRKPMSPNMNNDYTGKFVYKLGETLLNNEDIILTTKPKLNFNKLGYLEPQSREDLLKYHPEVVLYCPQIPQIQVQLQECVLFLVRCI